MFQDQLSSAKKLTTQALGATQAQALKSYYQRVLEEQKQFAGEAIPHRGEEAWRYVDLKFFQKSPFELAVSTEPNTVEVSGEALTFSINNTSATAEWIFKVPLPNGLKVLDLAAFASQSKPAIAEQVLSPWTSNSYFSRLSENLNAPNVFLVIDKSFQSKLPIEIQFLGPKATDSNQFFNSRLIVVLEPGAEATIVERTHLNDNCFINSGVDYHVDDNSQLKILKIEKGTGRGCHTARYKVARDAKLFSTTATVGSTWSRHNVFVELNAPGAQAEMLATYLAEGDQFVDHHTAIEHKSGHTTSLQKYTGVLADKAKAVFNGQVKIDRNAQKSSAVQINRNLLLSKTAEVNTKPELQIDADDVQAKHGATVGQILPDELFYLQSRGIPEAKARTMLTRGFIEEIGLLQPESLKSVYFSEVSGFLDKVAES